MDEYIDYSDKCPSCGAGYTPRYAAFQCGAPSADCPTQIALAEEAAGINQNPGCARWAKATRDAERERVRRMRLLDPKDLPF